MAAQYDEAAKDRNMEFESVSVSAGCGCDCVANGVLSHPAIYHLSAIN